MMYVVFLLLTFPMSRIGVEQPWEETLFKNGVVVYTREVDYSPIREFLAKATMKGSIKKFREILTDPGLQPAWLPNCIETRLVATSGPDDITYHMKLKVPFPFENRDLVQRLILRESGGQLKVNIINQKEAIPELDNFVRMPELGGSWRVKELPGGKIKVQFQYFANPGGKIPAWLINTFVVKNPYNTLINLRKLMEE